MSSRFCEECGTAFERITAKFCRQCGTPRVICPDGAQTRMPLEVTMPKSPDEVTKTQTRRRTEETVVEPMEEIVVEPMEEAVVEPMEGHLEEQDVEDSHGHLVKESTGKQSQQKPPSYNMIFAPPGLHNRVKNKLYGRRCLKHEYPIQHKCYVDNYKRTHAWIAEGQSLKHLPEGAFTLEDPSVRDALKQIISENKNNLMDIKFGKDKKYEWSEADIYKKMRKNLKYRRWKQRKAERVANSNPSETSVASEGHSLSSLPQPRQSSQPGESVPLEGEEGDDETFVMHWLGVENVHKMYAELSNFMNSENEIARSARKRPPFPPNSKSFAEGDKLFLVARFLCSQRE